MNENTAIDPESEQNSLLFTTVQDEYRVLKQEQRSRIGFRDNLLYMTLGVPKERLYRWEYAHRREEDGRFKRKLFQLVVDLTAFCISSAVGLLTFLRLVANPSTTALILVWAGWILTLILAAWIWTYADFSQ
ncbi:MAG: hypothetical protein GY927_06920 [bacterium]|nr:hypothetical protein [bacterium]